MKPFFIKSSVGELNYLRGDLVINKPVNLSLCQTVHKDRLRWYPDNTGLPTINFKMMSEDRDVMWAYKTEQERDSDYEIIVNNNFLE